MDGTALAGSGLRGDRQVRYDLVGDHVAVLPDVTFGSLRRATWSPTNLCYAGYTPHEGCKEASHPTAIVGLMRNNLSEVSASLPALLTSQREPSRLYSEQVQSPASAGSVATAKEVRSHSYKV